MYQFKEKYAAKSRRWQVCFVPFFCNKQENNAANKNLFTTCKIDGDRQFNMLWQLGDLKALKNRALP
jgi:hypothetical protein